MDQLNNSTAIIWGDAISEMGKLDTHSIDLIATDLPYGTTQNKWDSVLPIDYMWAMFKRVLKPEGTIVLTAAQPFASTLVMSNLEWFKYDLIWKKTIASGQLNVKRMPLRLHEHILVFYKKFTTYNEQKTKGQPYHINRKPKQKAGNYGKQRAHKKINDGYRHAVSVLEFPNPRIKGGHPTQKPVQLMEYIVQTYANEGDSVLDCCMGSGTTGVACIKTDRQFIGIELSEKYYMMAKARLLETIQSENFETIELF